jgi:hypothetical protein
MIARLLCTLGLLVVFCGVVAPAGGTPAVPATDAVDSTDADRPFAEAGLDQTVPVGAVVYLDAYGSRAATGNLTAYEWRIERPDGTIVAPDCPNCELTQFQPTRSGEYAVTLTVEDEAGRTATDTMYVTVRDRAAPQATLSGPENITLNETAQINLSAQASVGNLQSVEWYVDSDYRRGEFLDTERVERSLRFAPETVGQHTIAAVVRNDNGTARRVRHDVTVSDPVPFEVTLTDAADTVEAGQYWAPAFEVTNTGSTADTQEIILNVPGVGGEITSETITLDPGETRIFWNGNTCAYSITNCDPTLAWFTSPSDAGAYTAFVESETDTASTSVQVYTPPNFEISVSNIRTDSWTSPGSGLDYTEVIADVSVRNTGGEKDSQDIRWEWAPLRNQPLANDLTLYPNESRTFTSRTLANKNVSINPLLTQTIKAWTEDQTTYEDFEISGSNDGGDDPYECKQDDNCILTSTVLDMASTVYSGEYTNIDYLTFAFGPDNYLTQTQHLTADANNHPYKVAPTEIKAEHPGDMGEVVLLNNYVEGFRAKSHVSGQAKLRIGDDVAGLDNLEYIQIVDPGDDGGGGDPGG